jgi:hypothetical protein
MRKVDVSKFEQECALRTFSGSVLQKVLHNAAVDRLESYHRVLEQVDPSKLLSVQGEIKECRAFLALLHASDPPGLRKEIYE